MQTSNNDDRVIPFDPIDFEGGARTVGAALGIVFVLVVSVVTAWCA